MIPEIVLFLIAFLGSFLCGVWDLKTSNIPSSIVILMVVFSLVVKIANILITEMLADIVASIVIGVIFYIIGMLIYHRGYWGEGDALLLASLGFILPFQAFKLFFLVSTIGLIYSYCYLRFLKIDGTFKIINTKDLKPDDVIGEDIPKLNIYQNKIRGLSIEEVKEIQKIKKKVSIKDGIRFGPVFTLALLFLVFIM